jgi:hypothetical protein
VGAAFVMPAGIASALRLDSPPLLDGGCVMIDREKAGIRD